MNSTSSATATATLRPAATAHARASFARRAVLRELARLPLGLLVLELPDGTSHRFGNGETGALPAGVESAATIRVRNNSFFSKCIWGGDIGFAEAYLDGDWETPDLVSVIAWFILNVEHAPTLSGSRRGTPWHVNLLRGAHRLGHLLRSNTRRKARENIGAHYDLSNEFFGLFLDPSMMYSSALWTDPDLTLEQAQHAKNDALCQSLRLTPRDHVLEIGSGWGGWAIHAARNYGCRVTTLTLSQEQLVFARHRIEAAGLSQRIEVRLQDYRDVEGHFDKLVSIEMLEAVGHAYHDAYFRACSRLVRPGGLIALQFITCPDARYAALRKGVDFIQKHIFPGSLLLSLNRVNTLLARHGGWTLHALRDFGPDYARTLREWRRRFHERRNNVAALGFDGVFLRKWDYYLAYCEAAFAMRNISVVHTLHARPNTLSL